VFETCAARDEEATSAGVMLMPGVGFDVVPSDCLAVHLKNRLPGATHLRLAFVGLGGISHGTRATMTMNVGKGGAIRREGKIVNVPAAWSEREIDFGKSKKLCTTIPWGDVSTAFHSTGIPNIEVYTSLPDSSRKMLKLSRYIGWLLAMKPFQNYLQKQIPAGGPSAEARAKGRTFLFGEAWDDTGNRVAARQEGPEGYNTTVLASLKIVEKVLVKVVKIGFQTPAKAFGENLILEIEGTKRENVTA